MDPMEVIRIQVKPRVKTETNDKPETIVNINEKSDDETPKPSCSKSLQKEKKMDVPSRDGKYFKFQNQVSSADAFEFKIHKIPKRESVSKDASFRQGKGAKANDTNQVTALSKVAWPENVDDGSPKPFNNEVKTQKSEDKDAGKEKPGASIRSAGRSRGSRSEMGANFPLPNKVNEDVRVEISIDEDGSPKQGNTEIETITMIDDDTKSEDEDKATGLSDADNKKPGTSKFPAQVDVGHEGGEGSGQKDDGTPTSYGTLPSGENVSTNASFLKPRKKFLAKRKRRQIRKRGKRATGVVPCDDTTSRRSGERGNKGESYSNPSVTIEITEGDSGIGSHGNDHDLISALDDLSDEESEAKTLLRYLLESYFWLGLCPRRLNKKTWFVNWIHFAILIAVAMLHVIVLTKNAFFWIEDDLTRCMSMGFHIIGLVLRLLFGHLMIRFKRMKELARLLSSAYSDIPKSKIIAIVVVLVSTSLLTAILDSIAASIEPYIAHGDEFDIEDLLSSRAYWVADSLLVWNKGNRFNQTAEIYKDFAGAIITPKEIYLGIIGFFIQIVGYLFRNIMLDISIAVAVSVLGLTTVFLSLLDSDKTPTEEECDRIWYLYKLLQRISILTEKALGVLLQIMHAENIFLTSLFLYENAFSGEKPYLGVVRVCFLAKVLLFYIIAAAVYAVNLKFRRWVRKTFPGPNTLFKEKSQYITTSNVLDELKTDPIAIGSSFLYINYSFLGKFVTYVSSAFFFFVQHGSGE